MQLFKSLWKRISFNRLYFGIAAGFLMIAMLSTGSAFAFASPASTNPAQVLTPIAATPQPSPTPQPAVQIVISQRYLNQVVKEAIQTSPDLSNPDVQLLPGNRANVTVDLRMFNTLTVRPTVTLALTVQNHKIHSQIIATQFSGFSAPASVVESRLRYVENQMELTINSQLLANLSEAGLQLDSLQTTNTQLIANLVEIPTALLQK